MGAKAGYSTPILHVKKLECRSDSTNCWDSQQMDADRCEPLGRDGRTAREER
jgi:hypothetical protein